VAGKTVDYGPLGRAPWTELNDLFGRFNFSYRFRDDYAIREDGSSLDEKPKLFQIDDARAIIEAETRHLAELSDGEQSIIPLIIGSRAGGQEEETELLLLDGFDATLNPSLTNVLFAVLDEYFVSKGKMVVMVSHSPTTIAMAPKGTHYFEVFSRGQSLDRIIKVSGEEYSELKLAHKGYLDRISDQSARIHGLERERERLKGLISDGGKLSVLVEGPTDVDYLRHAAKLLDRESTLDRVHLDIIGENTPGGARDSNNQAQRRALSFLRSNIGLFQRRIVLLFDPEEQGLEEGCFGERLFERQMKSNPDCSLRKGIESLLSAKVVIEADAAKRAIFKRSSNGTGSEERQVIGKKKDLFDWMCENSKAEDFECFGAIFDMLDSVSDAGQCSGA